MRAVQPNVAKVELIANALGDLCSQLIFVGGCAVDLLLTDPAAAPARITYDVDLVARIDVLIEYHALEREFDRRGFKRELRSDAPTCRWRFQNLEVDLMPMDAKVLGFANRWYPLAIETAQEVMLSTGITIRLISAPAFIATKFEAFLDRGQGDYLASHDLEDIINVLDGRPELVDEILAAPLELQRYLISQFQSLQSTPSFIHALQGMLFPDESLADRVKLVAQRLALIASLKVQ